jgi:hypothetical protein
MLEKLVEMENDPEAKQDQKTKLVDAITNSTKPKMVSANTESVQHL